MNYICRICENSEDLIKLNDENNPDILNKLVVIADIIIDENDLLPQNICKKCKTDLEFSYNFKMKCENSDKRLRKLLTHSKKYILCNLSIEAIEEETFDINIEKIEDGEVFNSCIYDQIESSDSDKINLAEVITDSNSSSSMNNFKLEYENINNDKEIDDIHNEDYTEKLIVSDYKNADHTKKNIRPNESQCKICHKWFTKNYLRNHMLAKHLKKHRYECETCNLDFTRLTNLNRHIRQVHLKEFPFECEICNKKFSHKSILIEHQVIHIKIDPKYGAAAKFVCQFCYKAFTRKILYDTHLRIHTGEKPFKCQNCDMSFGNKQTLKSHNFIHTGERPYKCKECNANFRQLTHLVRHQNIHDKSKQDVKFKCYIDFCSKEYTQLPNLQRHIRFFHKKILPFSCDACGKSFLQKWMLVKHEVGHDIQKHTITKCRFCAKKFKGSKTLQKHEESHHNKLYELAYEVI